MRVRRRPGGAREVGPGHGLSDRAAMPQQGGQTGIQALFSLGGDADSAPPTLACGSMSGCSAVGLRVVPPPTACTQTAANEAAGRGGVGGGA